MVDLLNKFEAYLQSNNLILKGDSLILGVSGGPDSLAMLDLFNRLKERYALRLVVFHLNHGFRREAQDEAKFVAQLAQEYGLKAIVEEYNVPALIAKAGLSPEEAARQVRFQLIKKWARELQIEKVALAHNKDDLVETIFLNLFRGTGLKGLSGIEPLLTWDSITLIHPLLGIYRKEIEAYCQVRELKPRRDPSNQELVYTRNKIRHQLIPYLEQEINPAVKEVISRMARIVHEEENYLQSLAQDAWKTALIKREEGRVILSLKKMAGLVPVIRNRVFKMALQLLKGDYNDFYSYHYQALENLIDKARTGKKVELMGKVQARVAYGQLILENKSLETKKLEYRFEFNVPGCLLLPGDQQLEAEYIEKGFNWRQLAQDPRNCFCDAAKLSFPLFVRNRRPGDRFRPLGMKGVKKLKDFFIDEKIARDKRSLIPILIDSKGKIIWIAGYRMDDRYKVDAGTKKILKISIIKKKGD